jgi:hypothetical protein
MKVIGLFDNAQEAEISGNRAELERAWQEIHSFTDGRALQKELERFLNHHKLPTLICADISHWRMFFSLYTAIISDIPLEFELPVKHIRKVVVNKGTAKRRSGDGPTPIEPFREAFSLAWMSTTFSGEEVLSMLIEFPEEWLSPVPHYVQPEPLPERL